MCSTGGKRMEFRELVGISKELRVKVWKVFSLEDASEALRSLDSHEREGRIMLKP